MTPEAWGRLGVWVAVSAALVSICCGAQIGLIGLEANAVVRYFLFLGWFAGIGIVSFMAED